MSLINEVLKDIDERCAAEFSEAKTELDDLHFAHTPPAPKKFKPVIVGGVVVVAVMAVAIAGYYFYSQHTPQPEAEGVAAENNQAANNIVANQSVSTAQTNQTSNKPKQNTSTAKQVATKRQTVKPTPVATKSKPAVAVSKSTSVAQEAKELTMVTAQEADEPIDDSPVKFSRSSVPLRPEQKAERAYQQGYDQLKAHRNRQAEQSLRQALAMQQSHIKARELLAGMYIQQGRWIEASELLRQGVSVAPQHITFRKLYARSLMQLNRDQQAIEVLNRQAPAIAQDPNYFAMLAALYQRQNQHAEAAEIYARLVSINARNGVWWVGMGISLEALGRQQDAKQAYGHARNTGNLGTEVARFTDNRLLALEELRYPVE